MDRQFGRRGPGLRPARPAGERRCGGRLAWACSCRSPRSSRSARRGWLRPPPALVALAPPRLGAQPQPIEIDPDDIAGVVTSERGPEAGVWVIAETDDLPTKFRKIVVTDDAGRYLLPDLPAASYTL